MADGKAPLESLVQVFAVKENNLDEVSAPLMDGWNLVSLDSNGFEIKLNFTNPIAISADDEPDLLLLQLDLSQFKDQNGKSL